MGAGREVGVAGRLGVVLQDRLEVEGRSGANRGHCHSWRVVGRQVREGLVTLGPEVATMMHDGPEHAPCSHGCCREGLGQ